MADLTSLFVDRASLGVTATTAPSSVLRLGTLAAPAVGASRLAVDATGNVTAGVLVPGDIPSVFTRRDVAETISQPWTWTAGAAIIFDATGAPAIPSGTGRSTGTRLVIYPQPGQTEFAIGIAPGAMWQSAPVNTVQRWYTGTAERMRLDSDGTLNVINGSGYLVLADGVSGSGAIVTSGGGLVISPGTTLQLNSGSGQIVPVTGYRENLGTINKKYLTLHCAELWAETLVAQDTLATIGGRILVGSTTMLTRDLSAASTIIFVKHNSFVPPPGEGIGSQLILQVGGQFEVMSVRTPALLQPEGDYRYEVYRDADGSGTSAWTAGDAVFDTGTAALKSGFIDLYSVRGLRPGTTAGPTIVGNVRTGSGATEWREHWAIGNLQGVYGNGTPKMGAAFGDTAGTHIQIDSTDGFTIRAGPGTTGAVLGHWSMANVITLGYGGGSQIIIDPNDGSLRMKYAGADKIVLLSDGNAYLNSGLVCGAFGGTFPYIRSNNALSWNSGRGFYFGYDTATGLAYGLLGSFASPARYIQWNGSTLKLVSDGVTIDEAGITMLQNSGSSAQAGRLIRFGTSGGYLWDTTAGGDGNGEFYIVRQYGNVNVRAQQGSTSLGAQWTTDSAYLTVTPTFFELNGIGNNGTTRPVFRPAVDYGFDLGQPARRWANIYTFRIQLRDVFSPYQIELMYDQAVKPTSSTWIIASDARVKRDVRAVDRDDALALVRRVPIVRFTFNGELGTPDGTEGIGVVAQELAPILPASVTERPDNGALMWNAHELLMLNVAAVQALAARLDRLDEGTH